MRVQKTAGVIFKINEYILVEFSNINFLSSGITAVSVLLHLICWRNLFLNTKVLEWILGKQKRIMCVVCIIESEELIDWQKSPDCTKQMSIQDFVEQSRVESRSVPVNAVSEEEVKESIRKTFSVEYLSYRYVYHV